MSKSKNGDSKPSTELVAVRMLLEGQTVTACSLAKAASKEPSTARTCIRHIERGLSAFVEHDDGNPNMHAVRLKSSTGLPHAQERRTRLLSALCVAQSLMGAFGGTAMREEIRKTIVSLLATGSGRADDLSRRVRGPARALIPGAAGEGVIDCVVQGLLESRRLNCTYTTNEAASYRVELDPLTLLLDDIGVHLLADCVQSTPDSARVGRRMTYAMARLSDVTLGTPFSYPAGVEFNAEALFGPSFGLFVPRPNEDGTVYDVVLRFDSTWESYLRAQPMHASQQIEVLAEAGGQALLVRLRVYVMYDLVHWIRGHGDSVSVMEPPRLKRWVEQGYGRKGPPDTAPSNR